MPVKNLFTFIFLFILSLSLVGQKDYRKGRIIKINNDSVPGLIKFKGDIRNSLSCTYKNNLSTIEEFKPGEINGYRFDKGKLYVSKYARLIEGPGQFFVEYLVGGKKNLYFVRDKRGSHFFVGSQRDTITEIYYKEEFTYRDGIYYKQESTDHLSLLNSYFSDCPALFPEIRKIARPDINNLMKLMKNYHRFNPNDSSYRMYYTKSKIKIFIEPHIGIVNYKRMASGFVGDPNESSLIAQSGIHAYLWLPKSSENLYFKTGYTYAKYNLGIPYTILKIPIQFEYQFLPGAIRPFVDIGFNFYSAKQTIYKGKLLTFACGAGVQIKLNNHLYYEVNVNSDLLSFAFNAPLVLNYSAETGIRITL